MTLNSTGLGIGTSPSTNLHVAGNAIVSEQLFVGGNSGSSNLNVSGTIGFEAQTVNSDTSLGAYSIVLADTSSANVILTLPLASMATGKVFYIKKTSVLNQLWIDSSANIDSQDGRIELTYPNSGYSFTQLISNGSQWYILNQSNDAMNVIGADNLVGWWKLDETSGGVARDYSIYSNTATISDITSMGNTGIFNGSYYFDGVNDYLSAGNSSSLDNKDKITVSLWMKGDPTASDWAGLIKKQSGSVGWFLEKRSNLTTLHLRVDTDAGFNQAFQSNAAPFDNEWHHICFEFNSGSYSWYIDGALDKSGSYNHGSGFASTGALKISDSTNDFKGLMDDVRVYNKILTSSEVQALYAQGQ